MRARISAPRAFACSSRSSTSTPAPSPMTKPSRSASNGRETPSRESAPMRLKAAMHSPVSAASVPPATTASTSPRTIIRVASPIGVAAGGARARDAEARAVGAEAHRDRAGGRVGHHHRHEVRGDGTVAALQPRLALVLQGREAADAGAHEHAEALGVDAVGQAGLLGRLHRRGHRELRVAVGAPRLLGRHGDLGVEVDARADAVGDARALGQQGLEEGVRPLTDGGDDAASCDDDRGHAVAPAFSRVSSCTSAAASPTVAIDFSRPSAICTS